MGGEIMDKSIDCVHPVLEDNRGHPLTLMDFLMFLKKAKHGGYPLTRSKADSTLLGYVYVSDAREKVEEMLEEEGSDGSLMNAPVAFRRFIPDENEAPLGEVDLSDLVTVAVTRIVEETPAAQAHYMFRNLGIN